MTALTAVVDLLRAKVGAVVQKEGKKAITAGAANITTNTDNDNNGGMAGVETIVNPVPWYDFHYSFTLLKLHSANTHFQFVFF